MRIYIKIYANLFLECSLKLFFQIVNKIRHPARLIDQRILVVGVGGIGSFLVQALAKMGIDQIEIWDADKVESHNLPNQNYGIQQLGMSKVYALRENVFLATGVPIQIQEGFWTGREFDFNPTIIITAIDSMTGRQLLWDYIRSSNAFTSHPDTFYLDARMSSRGLSLYCLKFNNEESIRHYEKIALYSDAEAVQESCTAKAIIHTSYACTYVIGNAIHEIVKNGKVRTSYHADLEHLSFTKEKKEVF